MERQVALARLPHKIKDRIYGQIAVVLEEAYENEERTADFYRLAGDLTSCLRLLKSCKYDFTEPRKYAHSSFSKVYDVHLRNRRLVMHLPKMLFGICAY